MMLTAANALHEQLIYGRYNNNDTNAVSEPVGFSAAETK
jgi:hypothetical protein